MHVVDVHAEPDARAVVFDRFGFHEHAARDKLVVFEHGSDAVAHVVARAAHVAADFAFKRFHDVGVHMARAGDEVRFVGVFCRKLPADKVAAVVERLIFHKVVELLVPAGRVNLADVAAFARGHRVAPDARLCRAAATEQVERGIGLIAFGQVGLAFKVGHVAVELEVGKARIVGEVVDYFRWRARRACGAVVLRGRRAPRHHRHQGECEHDCRKRGKGARTERLYSAGGTRAARRRFMREKLTAHGQSFQGRPRASAG